MKKVLKFIGMIPIRLILLVLLVSYFTCFLIGVLQYLLYLFIKSPREFKNASSEVVKNIKNGRL